MGLFGVPWIILFPVDWNHEGSSFPMSIEPRICWCMSKNKSMLFSDEIGFIWKMCIHVITHLSKFLAWFNTHWKAIAPWFQYSTVQWCSTMFLPQEIPNIRGINEYNEWCRGGIGQFQHVAINAEWFLYLPFSLMFWHGIELGTLTIELASIQIHYSIHRLYPVLWSPGCWGQALNFYLSSAAKWSRCWVHSVDTMVNASSEGVKCLNVCLVLLWPLIIHTRYLSVEVML